MANFLVTLLRSGGFPSQSSPRPLPKGNPRGDLYQRVVVDAMAAYPISAATSAPTAEVPPYRKPLVADVRADR